MHMRSILVLAFCSISFFSQGVRNQELDKLLQEIKEARLNSVKAELPEGIHWLEGYYSSGLFYLCSNPNGLHLRDEENKLQTIADNDVHHVEFTADLSKGNISIIEVHSVATEQPSHCSFTGQSTDAT